MYLTITTDLINDEARLEFSSGLILNAAAWVPMIPNRRGGQSGRYYENDWRASLSLHLPDLSEMSFAPTLASFSPSNRDSASIRKLLNALGVSCCHNEAERVIELIRELRMSAMTKAEEITARQDAAEARKQARKQAKVSA